MTQAARSHSYDMAVQNFTGHTGSDGSTPGQRMQRAGYSWIRAGEIAGWGFSDPASMMRWWMDDPPHKEVILSAAYEDLGVGYVQDPNSEWEHYWTVDFGVLALQAAADEGELYACTFASVGASGGSSLVVYSTEPCPPGSE